MKRIAVTALIISAGFAFFAGAQKGPSSRARAAALATIPFNNPGVIEYPNPEKFTRVVAISDTHGEWQNLFNLFLSTHLIAYNQATQNITWMGGKTLIVVVGDSIDKGPDSLYVIDFWMNLTIQARAVGGDVIHCLGNHEAEFLADPSNPHAQVFLDELKAKGVPLEQLVNPVYPRAAFLRSMPMAVRVGHYLFMHAGLFPQMNWNQFTETARTTLSAGKYSSPFLLDDNSGLEAKDWWQNANTKSALEANLAANGFYGVVFGHMPTALNVTNDVAQTDNEKLIKIDSGMAPEAGNFPGHMLVFLQPAQLNIMAPPQAISMTQNGVTHPL